MKRISLLLLMLISCLQMSMAQALKPVQISFYPVVHDPHELLKSISDKLLPYQKHITTRPLEKYFGRFNDEIYGNQNAAEADSTADFKKRFGTLPDTDGYVAAAAAEAADNGEDVAFHMNSYVQVNPQDEKIVMRLLNLAREKQLYDTSRYIFGFGINELMDDWLILCALDKQSPYAIPTASFTAVRKDEISDGSVTGTLSLTRQDAKRLVKLYNNPQKDDVYMAIDNKLQWPIDKKNVPVNRRVSFFQEIKNVAEGQLFMKRMQASVVKEPTYKPLLPSQYTVGDTLTYRIKVDCEMKWITGTHTFKLVPLVVNNDLCRLECIVEGLDVKLPDWQTGAYDKELNKLEAKTLQQMLKQHFIIEANNLTGETNVEVKDQKMFDQWYKNLKRWCQEDWKRNRKFSRVTDETMRTTEGENILYHLDNFIKDGSFIQYMPELTAMIGLEMHFDEGETTGREYFDLLGDYGTYNISKDKQGFVVSLKGDPEIKDGDFVDESDPAIQDMKTRIDSYGYRFDTKGKLLQVKGDVRRNLYYKSFVIDRVM
ncbi:hypothetical protein [Prevotella sp.]|uniref:hypothetical protein n=1 Tax=Prevotella sp. TaxID=59823 RepID=UPI001CAF7D25|nr:hypothetical protein [Prevotella sp.]MBF1627673.1 hypothetical protein [Prevotella sp.]